MCNSIKDRWIIRLEAVRDAHDLVIKTLNQVPMNYCDGDEWDNGFVKGINKAVEIVRAEMDTAKAVLRTLGVEV